MDYGREILSKIHQTMEELCEDYTTFNSLAAGIRQEKRIREADVGFFMSTYRKACELNGMMKLYESLEFPDDEGIAEFRIKHEQEIGELDRLVRMFYKTLFLEEQ